MFTPKIWEILKKLGLLVSNLKYSQDGCLGTRGTCTAPVPAFKGKDFLHVHVWFVATMSVCRAQRRALVDAFKGQIYRFDTVASSNLDCEDKCMLLLLELVLATY